MVHFIHKHQHSIADSFRSHPRRYSIFGVFLFVVLIMAVVFWPRQVTFSYAQETCIYQPTIAPELLRSTSDTYRLEASQTLSVGGVVIAAASMCVVPLQAPDTGTAKAELSVAGLPFIKKSYYVHASAPPVASVAAIAKKPVPTSRKLSVPLSESDAIFNYKLMFNDQGADCVSAEGQLLCDVPELQLRQGTAYTMRLDRYFNGKKVATVAQQQITTLTATSVVDTSIKPGQVVYAKPKTIDLLADKDVTSATIKVVRIEGEKRQEIAAQTIVDGKKITLNLTEDLPRQSRYELIAEKVIGNDGSGLDGPFKLAFDTSGGPKVKSMSVGNYKVPVGATAIVTFDQPIIESQDVATAVKAGGGATVTGKKGNQVFISFAGVPRCGDVSITVSDTLQSDHGITGGSAWRFDTRTICQTQFSIGASVKGRSIAAYSFGSGPQTVLYTGAIHGSEASTRALMMRWIDELEMKPRSIPAGKTVVVIPAINPDGVVAGSRTNANNVDLNRNFATSDWKSDITTVTNAPFPGGGGQSALSEPEAKAIASYVARTKPRLVLSYHSIGGLLAANQSGDSLAMANVYTRLSGYGNTTGAPSTFEYSVSGTADDYYGQILGVPSILIELGSHTDSQFARNRDAMWAMIK